MSFSTLSGNVDVLGNIFYLLGFCLAFIPFSFIYFNLKVIIPRYFEKNRYGMYANGFLVCVLLFLLVTYMAKYLILSAANIKEEFSVYVLLDGLSNFMLYAICAISSSVTALLKQWTNDTHKIENLENAWIKSNLEELKTRINPTFLYGILDHSSEKIKTEPEKASALLLQLSELLRYELYDCKRERVLLKSDIQFIENYLSLVRQNSDNQFTYSVRAKGKTDYFIPPFIFMPFIQEIMLQEVLHLTVDFKSEYKKLRFTVKTDDANLSQCNFYKIEQKLAMLYTTGFSIIRDNNSVEVMLGNNYEL